MDSDYFLDNLNNLIVNRIIQTNDKIPPGAARRVAYSLDEGSKVTKIRYMSRSAVPEIPKEAVVFENITPLII
ncbi:MAG: hypothetical protein ACM3RX_04465, partial [Methanococcaceae archaeon]